MQVDFQTLDVDGFKGFAGHQTLDLSLTPGLYSVRGKNELEPRLGSNGSGKTSLWQAVTWCLYGKTVEGLRNPDILPRKGKKKASVTVTIERGGKPYAVNRTANPNKLTINGKIASQEQVDRLLVPFNIFAHTILHGQGQPLFFDLQPREKMQLISEVCQFERWDARSSTAANEAKELEDKRDVLVVQQEKNKATISELNKQLADSQERGQVWEKGRKEKLKEAKKQLAAAQAELSIVTNEVEKIGQKIGQKTDTHAAWEKAVSARIVAGERVRALEKQKNGSHCPTCGQKIGQKIGQTETKKKLEAAQKALEVAIVREREANKAADADSKAREALHKCRTTIPSLTHQVRTCEATIKECGDKANPFADQMEKAAGRLAILKKKMWAFNADIEALDLKIEQVRFWVKGFKDVRLFVIDELLEELELATNSALEDLGLVDWEVHYSTERENKSGTYTSGLHTEIISPSNKSAVKWEAWSGGEGQRLRLIGSLALSEILLAQTGVETNLEVLDEPTRGLSGEGGRDLCELLAERAEVLGKATWLVDHTTIESSKIAGSALIVKDKMGSRIEQ